MAISFTTLKLANKYTEETTIGLGAIKGSPCTISNVETDEDGNTVLTFEWTGTDGTVKTQKATINKGEDGIGVKGDKGDKGDRGQDGYTPIKGVDYFTQSDIVEFETVLKHYIDEQIGGALNGSY